MRFIFQLAAMIFFRMAIEAAGSKVKSDVPVSIYVVSFPRLAFLLRGELVVR